jgi:hypothetical protein
MNAVARVNFNQLKAHLKILVVLVGQNAWRHALEYFILFVDFFDYNFRAIVQRVLYVIIDRECRGRGSVVAVVVVIIVKIH